MSGHIERIRVFVEVARRESFAAAARALGLTRSQVTRYVGELEADVGVRLLTRTTRQVSLSAGGRLYLERIKPILADLSRAEELVRQQHDTLKGEIRVSAPLSFGVRFLPDAISQFRILYPDVKLKLPQHRQADLAVARAVGRSGAGRPRGYRRHQPDHLFRGEIGRASCRERV